MPREPEDMPVALEAPFLEEPQWVTCPRCNEPVAPPCETQCWECDRADERARARSAAMRRSGLSKEHEWAETTNPECVAKLRFPSAAKLRARIVQLLEPQTVCPVVTLTGPSGIGKTTFGVLLAKARLSACLFVTSHELAEAVGQHALGKGDPDLVARAKEALVLVIDELRVPALPSAKDALENLVWFRIRNGLLTVFTHGFSPEDIARDWGAGMHRRMYVDGQHVALDGATAKRSAA